MELSYTAIKNLIDSNVMCRIMRAEKAAFIITFLDRAYVSTDGRARSESELIDVLASVISNINQTAGADIRIDPRRQLTEWASDRCRYLRRFTKPDSTEYFYDITQQGRRTVDMVSSLVTRPYVGTEARLNIIMNVVKEIVLQGSADKRNEYLEELKKQRARLDERIAAIESGQVAVLTPEEISDRFYQFEELSRGLISDLREVEENFRNLYRDIRREVESDEGPKAILLDKFFEKTDLISSSEQGRSAAAFNRLLLSAVGRELLENMLDELYQNQVVQDIKYDTRLTRLYPTLLENSRQINSVIAGLDKQLNYFIGSQLYLEAKSIKRVCKKITARTTAHSELMELKEEPFLTFELPVVTPMLPVDRPLFTEKAVQDLLDDEVPEGDENTVNLDSLLTLKHIDVDKLRERLYLKLARQGSTTLQEVIAENPPEFGAEEVFAYRQLAAEEFEMQVSPGVPEKVGYESDPDAYKGFSVMTMDRTEIRLKDEQKPGAELTPETELAAYGAEELIEIIDEPAPRPRKLKEGSSDAAGSSAESSAERAEDGAEPAAAASAADESTEE